MILLPLNRLPIEDFFGGSVSYSGEIKVEDPLIPHYRHSLRVFPNSEVSVSTSETLAGDFTLSFLSDFDFMDSYEDVATIKQDDNNYISIRKDLCFEVVICENGIVSQYTSLEYIRNREPVTIALTKTQNNWKLFINGSIVISFNRTLTFPFENISVKITPFNGRIQDLYFDSTQSLFQSSYLPEPFVTNCITAISLLNGDLVDRRYHFIKRDLSIIRTFNSEDGFVMEPMFDSEGVLIKEGEDPTENSVPKEIIAEPFNPYVFKFASNIPVAGEWHYLTPINIDSQDSGNVVEVVFSDTSAEVSINGSPWESSGSVNYGDVLEIRVLMPTLHPLVSEVVNKVRIGSVVYSIRNRFNDMDDNEMNIEADVIKLGTFHSNLPTMKILGSRVSAIHNCMPDFKIKGFSFKIIHGA